ncbi:hypothetical protein ERJ75_000708800 [Trypanosoma vivax]|nr:hypothetical protein TRVL_08522 [Trypanosoma vivax]KAH8613637.1 hypothetical protein ERJ75_000708800 [Trypanosoma vivax]
MAKKSHRGAESVATFWLYVAVALVLAIVLYVASYFCFQAFYNNELAFRDALNCTLRVLRDYQVDSWLLNGTLLGSKRVGKILLWDPDLDIGFLSTSEDVNSSKMLHSLSRSCYGGHSSVRVGNQNSLRIFRMCSKNVCAEFHEAVHNEGTILTPGGAYPQTVLLPLTTCKISGIDTYCPQDTAYFLRESYGDYWSKRPIMSFFSL